VYESIRFEAVYPSREERKGDEFEVTCEMFKKDEKRWKC
jgi:hypothetical protein